MASTGSSRAARAAGLVIPVIAAVAVYTDPRSAAALQSLPGLDLDPATVAEVLADADPVEAGIGAAVAEARALLAIDGVAGVNLSGLASDRGYEAAAEIKAEVARRIREVCVTDAMDAEFDTVAEWTADAALRLGPEHHLPAACRGSGSPAALDWLIDNLSVRADDAVLDSGAGVGGPAAYLAQRTQARPVLLDPARGACRAARRLFGSAAVQGDAGMLPFRAAQFDVVWCLGVLCTTTQQVAILEQARRVLRASGRLGLLVYVARHRDLGPQPDGNNFPREQELSDQVERAGLRIKATAWLADLAAAPEEWRRREDDVEAELDRRHRSDEAWRTAQEQAARMAGLIGDGDVAGLLMTAELS